MTDEYIAKLHEARVMCKARAIASGDSLFLVLSQLFTEMVDRAEKEEDGQVQINWEKDSGL